ncbi:D-alanine--D-alanine ligase family protein [Oceanidesulfovibrio marinus]|uniref:D-alanine--D-alanine ligase n=1 Tax=Oceanidesulfovibrio marinus TaxID=370038 RepID=A0ABX6NG92_9BACT|nr:D-alanine--D-alanine ligase [Oceanidesulfovibrio marinus]QJT09648.1 D-alanine--D-alanine ligase [Oceanidesulfovibrio marinus]
MRIAVIHSDVGPSPTPDDMDTIVQAETVAAVLGGQGHDVTMTPVRRAVRHTVDALRRTSTEVVFNLVETIGGTCEGAYLLPSALEQAGIPFTGAGSHAMLLAGNKLAVKRLLRSAGVPTPPWVEEMGGEPEHMAGASFLPGPYVVKSVWEHGSHGLDQGSIIEFADRVAVQRSLAQKRRELGGAWFAEAFVSGREFCVGVVEEADGPRLLPTYEICFEGGKDAPRLVDYAAKWDEASAQALATPRNWEFSAEEGVLLQRMEASSLMCWRFLRLAGYARVDMRVDSAGVPNVIDVNSNPCISPEAGFAVQLERSGIGLGRGVGMIVEAALRRRGAPFHNTPTRKAA